MLQERLQPTDRHPNYKEWSSDPAFYYETAIGLKNQSIWFSKEQQIHTSTFGLSLTPRLYQDKKLKQVPEFAGWWAFDVVAAARWLI